MLGNSLLDNIDGVMVSVLGIGGVMVSVVASGRADDGVEPGRVKPKTIKLVELCCFSAKHAVLSRKSKDWLARIHDNLSEWGDMSICGLLFQ